MRFSLLPLAAVLATFAHAQGSPEGDRDALAVQQARTRLNDSTREKRSYSRPWDLSALPPYVPERQLEGTVRLRGNDAVTNGMLGRYWTDGFRKFQPRLILDFDLKSSAVALPALVTGTAEIGIGRHINFMELLGFQRTFGYDPTQIVALNGAYDALGASPAYIIVVNGDNPLSRINVAQLDGIFGAERNGGWVGTTWHPEFARGPDRNLRTWGQLGLTGRWKNEPIHPFAMNLQYNPTVDFDRMVLRGGGKWNEQLRQYSQSVRADGTLALGAQELVADVASDPDGIGISCLAYLRPGTKALPLAVAEEGPYVAPTIETVQDRSYFLHSECYFYVNRAPGKPLDPKTREFIRYVLSRDGQAEVVRDGKYLPMPADAARAELKKLE